MSFLLGFGQSFLSGLSSISSGLTSAVSGIVNELNGAFANFSNFFQQLPSNIQSFFQTVAGALIAFGHTFGSYILGGLQWIGNAISSAMVPIERGLNTDFVTGAAYVFDGIAQFFVQNATTIGALLAGVGLALFLANRFGLLDALKGIVSSIIPH